ncbi:thiol:disulfide interchange protein DsbG [Thorsellia anophelis]|uniref:Thiol:disulfide interchange protein n=1 Tax=Thorsellia anophelis DSM 18579 TaxID=1123402 RepID=A0A1I0E9N0_9GAMM|nr:thiol:disulfide interchange protein DsbG [Thorsellia anophelis]SET41872.1 thiol:disulfide interchange protein DsbG [Thorsellia anophelis DSM 18579]
MTILNTNLSKSTGILSSALLNTKFKLKHTLLAMTFIPAIALAEEVTYPEPIARWQQEGVSIVSEFKAPNGMRGFTAMYEGVGITLYLMADGEHVLWGDLYDAKGTDLSAEALEAAIYSKMAAELWERMEKSTWVQDGSTEAKQIVYVFTDPNCPYCREFWQTSRPWVESGKVQLRHILVGILSDESPLKAAAILNDKDPAAALLAYEQSNGQGALALPNEIDEKTLANLESNLEIMDALGASATPAIYYLSPKGRLQQQLGMPDDKQLKAIMGEPE